jgi:hypothetical protein
VKKKKKKTVSKKSRSGASDSRTLAVPATARPPKTGGAARAAVDADDFIQAALALNAVGQGIVKGLAGVIEVLRDLTEAVRDDESVVSPPPPTTVFDPDTQDAPDAAWVVQVGEGRCAGDDDGLLVPVPFADAKAVRFGTKLGAQRFIEASDDLLSADAKPFPLHFPRKPPP